MGIFASFTGVNSVLSASITLGHGASPSVGIVEMLPQSTDVPMTGDLVLGNDGYSVTIYDCLVDLPSMRLSSEGRTISFRVLDRRWRWQFGKISGRYNVRNSANRLDPASEKTPQELAIMLFQAMGESGFDVSQLPNDTRPEVEWIEDNPAGELEELADSLGCRIVPKLGNTFKLERLGVGDSLPIDYLLTRSSGFSPKPVPEYLRCVTGPARFQQRFRLEAVGKDTDGKIYLIDDLSYAPSGGWEKESPYALMISETDDKIRALAEETVFKWYRIVDDFSVVNYPDTNRRKDILPVDDFLVDQDVDVDGVETPKKAFVDGIYWEENPGNTSDSASTVEYKKGWSLDRERGIVQFSEFVVKLNSTTGEVSPAELYLTCSFNARGSADRQTVNYRYDRSLAGGIPGTGPKVIRRDEIIPTVKQSYDSSGNATTVVDNLSDVDPEINYHLDAAELEFQATYTDEAEYAGIGIVDLDGAIQQVGWEVTSGQGAVTRISRNTEHDHTVPSYEDVRQKKIQKKAASVLNRILKGGMP